jgi:uncharacterized membrane protein
MRDFDDTMVVSHFLRAGAILSLTFIAAGVILLFVRNGGDGYTLAQITNYSYSQLYNIDSKNMPLSMILPGIFNLDGIYFIALGLWLLIFTSVSVVVVRLVWFSQQKDIKFVIMTLIVLFNLFFAMIVIPTII